MPITFVDSEVVNVTSASTTITFTAANITGLADDDYMVFSVVHAESEDNDWTDVPAGLTSLIGELQVGQTPPSIPGLSVWAKFAASESGTYTFTGDFSSGMTGILSVYRGVDPATPQDATATTVQSTAGGNIDPAAITTQTANAWVLTMGFMDSSSISSPPTNYTSRGNGTTGAGGNGCSYMLADDEIVSAGSENPGTYTNTSDEWGCVTMALRPITGPTITSVDGDDDVDDLQTGVVIVGTRFEATQGTGKVEISESSDYDFGPKTAQTVTSWGDTSITITVAMHQVQVASQPGTSGNYCSTPDSVPAGPTSILDLRCKVQLDDWTAVQTLIAKWGAAGQRSYRFGILSAGNLRFETSANGTAIRASSSTAVPDFQDGEARWVRVRKRLVVDEDFIDFFVSNDGITWTQLGSSVNAGPSQNIFNSTSVLEIGSEEAGTVNLAAGEFFHAEVRNDDGSGPADVSFDPDDWSSGSTWTSSATSEVWTLNGTAAVTTEKEPGIRKLWVTNDSDERNAIGFDVHVHREHAFEMSLSSNFAPGTTTAQLTAPAGKTTGDFDGGRLEEALNPSTTNTDVTLDDYREDAWNIKALTAARGVTYSLRALYGGNVADTISQIPKITISTGPAGVGAQTLLAILQAGSGVQEFIGTGAQDLSSISQSGVGIMQPEGTGIQTLLNLLQAGVGEQSFIGTGTQTLDILNQAGVGIMQPAGAGAQTLLNLLQAGVGVEIFTGTGATILALLQQSGVGISVEGITGAGVTILALLQQSGVGIMHPEGAGAQTLFNLLQAGVGVQSFIGNGVQTLDALRQSGVGILRQEGAGAQTLLNLLQAGVGVEIFTGTGATILALLQQSGAGSSLVSLSGTGTTILATLLQSGNGIMQPNGTGASLLEMLLQAGSGVSGLDHFGTGAQTLSDLLQSGIGVMQPSGIGNQTLTVLAQTGNGIEIFTGAGAQILAALLQSGTGIMQPSGVGTQVLTALAQSGDGLEIFAATGAQTLDALLQSGVGLQTIVGTGDVVLSTLAQSGIGIMLPVGSGVQVLTSLAQSGSGAQIFIAVGDQTLLSLTQAGLGSMFFVGTGTQTLATLVQSGAGVQILIGTAAQILAALNQSGIGTAIGGILFVAEFIPLSLLPDINLGDTSDVIVTLGRDVGV